VTRRKVIETKAEDLTLVAGVPLLTGTRSLIPLLAPPLGCPVGEIPDIDLPPIKMHGRDEVLISERRAPFICP
jgi:hypothetical protein